MSESPKLKKHRSVRAALQYVVDNPELRQAPIDTPMWELIARTLFDIANNPDASKRGAMRAATNAQKMIADRLVGTRRPGTHPAVARERQVEFRDLTAGAIE